jgi:hypothetical protein
MSSFVLAASGPLLLAALLFLTFVRISGQLSWD